MTHYLDPIAAVEQPREDFIRYLLTAYPLRDPHLRYGLKQQLEQPGTVWQHPYLEGSQPYCPAHSVQELVSHGILHPDMVSLFTPSHRPLYEHQEKAVEAVIQQQENIVIATGTGSGKTECFLIPMLNLLLREEVNLSLAGVRTLILYPMNALVNDQVKRLRKLLCRQETAVIKFGFYTSRTETKKDKAEESLRSEFQSYEPNELRELFTEAEKDSLNLSTRDKLIEQAIDKTLKVQAISREEIWEKPPHILVTNYSMLEHMLIRPVERTKIFGASASTFKMLVVDEAHTYNGSTGSEVSMLLERLKIAVGVEEPGRIRCIATSASLGDASADSSILKFAEEFFGEQFSQVIRGDRVTATERLGNPYALPAEFTYEKILGYLSILDLPALHAPLNVWLNRLSGIVPPEELAAAQSQAGNDIHKFLWFSLKQHPHFHRLINILSRQSQRWEQIAQSKELWGINSPVNLDGSINDTDAKQALAHLLQLGTLARANPDDLPLVPVKLHLLFRSLEGLYVCINPDCSGGLRDPNYAEYPLQYGRLYLNEKIICDDCDSPVLELGSCYQCGQAYALTQVNNLSKLEPLPRASQELRESPRIYTLTSGLLESITEEEEAGEAEEEKEPEKPSTFTIYKRDGWIGIPSAAPFSSTDPAEGKFHLAWHRQKDDKNLDGCYLPKCAACGAKPVRARAINLFVAYTDAPLQAMIDSLFALLPEPESNQQNSSKRKLLTFSDGRQDAAFFASDYQRNHSETLYRQIIWQAFQEAKGTDDIASINQVINKIKDKFLEISIPHPERDSKLNYRSYVPGDSLEDKEIQNRRDCQARAEARAKELLVREFAIRLARRLSLEAFGILACHIDFSDNNLFERVGDRFSISSYEARIFLVGITDIIRRTGIVSIEGASQYFPEIGGVEGARNPILDPQGRSLNYLFLEKPKDDVKKYQESPDFLLKVKQSGELSKVQNRLGWYYLRLFGEQLPNREDFTWLFRQLQDSGLLVPAKHGHQLNWNLLNLIETKQHWYRCNRCQQLVHVPGLSQISHPTINVWGCPVRLCEGTLQPYTSEKIEQVTNKHYQQHLIKNRLPLPLRSQEHTAQLGVGELEKRENRFRRGQINMLSCSTTLEMGVDIGELQAVVLRNFPPHVSNYQQRAGRAGRRTDGVAVTLMYGQRRPHDRFYFEQPEQLIAGSNQIPKLDADNFQIQQRHIRAELLSAFLKTNGIGAEAVTIADFFSLPLQNYGAAPDFSPPPTAMVSELREWLHTDTTYSIAQSWLNRLKSSESAQNVLNQFLEALSLFQGGQLEDWNSLVSPLITLREDILAETDRKKRNGLEKRRDGIEAELDKIAKRRLHDELVQASILPIYGFPIDVVRLLTGESNQFKSSQGRHRLERDRRLALGEYAPGQEIVVDDRVYQSVGILRPNDLEKKYYWVCKNCNHFRASTVEEVMEECPVCGWEPTPATAQKMKAYKVPKAFTTDWTATPKVTPYTKPQRQPTSQVFLANDGENIEEVAHESGMYSLTVSQSGRFFLANQGVLGNGKGFNRQGFAICQTCGKDLSDMVKKEREANSQTARTKKSSASSKSSRSSHNHPITGKECFGSYYFIHLGHEFRSDLLKIQFDRVTKPMPLFGEVLHFGDEQTISSVSDNPNQSINGLGFWQSLTYAILAAAAQVIDVPRTELDGLFRPLADGRAEIIIYDNVPGGAGYSRRIAAQFQEVLEKAYWIVSSCSCDTSCYDCLRTYSNQPFHTELNRHVVAQFLKPLVEQIKPDPELQNFAPNANRVSLSQTATRLPALCRMAASASTIYLPSLIDSLGLNHGSLLSWFKLLTDAVYSMQRNGMPLELIVNQLPELNNVSDSAQEQRSHLLLLRKRLQQWIDQGLLHLYQSSIEALPALCLSTHQHNRIALELHKNLHSNESLEWFQTRSREGVEIVFNRLQNQRQQARLVPASELEDPDTFVVFPEPSWSNLSLTELRQKLQIDRILSGSQIKSVLYRDRYLDESGARILADLLQGEWLSSNSAVNIWVLEDSKSQSAAQRKAQLEAALTELNVIGIQPQVKVQPQHQRSHFRHGRDLVLHRLDGQKYKIIFDMGLNFVEVNQDGTYSIKQPTYVVITRADC
ncbi:MULTISPECIES: DEAD/DEAH box helicase [Oscillatoriales]|nr:MULTISPECIES: DEAD/DEAH box helicase [Oscillatoriales]